MNYMDSVTKVKELSEGHLYPSVRQTECNLFQAYLNVCR